MQNLFYGPTLGVVLGVNAMFPDVDGSELRLIAAGALVWRRPAR